MAEAIDASQLKNDGKNKREHKEEAEIDKLTDSLGAVALTDDLKDHLQTLQCPFTWEIKEELLSLTPYDIRERLKEKDEELEGDEGPDTVLRNFALQLAICYLEWRKGDTAAAIERHCNSEKLIVDCSVLSSVEALKHISNSTLAHLKYENGEKSECKAILKRIVPYSELDKPNKASISGIRVLLLMEYGYEGTKASLPYIEEALELDSSNAEWHFLLGKCLRRIRKVESYNEIPEPRELKALERAAEMSSSAGYYVFLAQSYRETAFRVFSLKKDDFSAFKEIVDDMNKKSFEYYRKALQMAPDSSRVNIRCAQGFLNLPYPHRNEDLVRKCLEKALESAPKNAMVHHVFGKYYERIGEVEKAKESYETAGKLGAFGAFMDFIRLWFKTDNDYNPVPVLQNVLGIFKEQRYKCEVLSQLASYYYLKENNLKKAIICMTVIAEECEMMSVLQNHKPLCANIKKPFHLLQVIIDESRLALSEEDSSLDESVYRKFISKYEDTDFLKSPPISHRTNLLEQAQRETKFSPYVRGQGRGQQRGNYDRQHGRQMGKEKFEIRCDDADEIYRQKSKYYSTNINSNKEHYRQNRNVYQGNANTSKDWRNRKESSGPVFHNVTSNTGEFDHSSTTACGNDNIEEKLKNRKEMSRRIKTENIIHDVKKKTTTED